MIIFDKIIIEGFGSIQKPLIYNLNSPGINILSARNGTGKTTIFSALTWALFGKTLKKRNSVQTWEKLRIPGFKGTKVSISFIKDKIHYAVIRHEGYKGKDKNRLTLIQDGKEREDLRDKKDVDKEIMDILGMSLDLFRNSIIFGQKMKRLIEEDGPTKKRVFEEIFETEYIQNAKVIAEENKQILSADLQKCFAENNLLEEKIKSAKWAKKRFKDMLLNFEQDKDKQYAKKAKELWKLRKAHIKSISERDIILKDNPGIKCSKLTKKLESLEKQSLQQREKENELFRVDFNLTQVKADVKQIKDTQKAFKKQLANRNNLCISCGQPIPKNKVIKEKKNIKKELKELSLKLSKALLDVRDLEAENKLLNEQLERYKQLTDQINNTKANFKLEGERLAHLNELKGDINFMDINLKKLDKEIKGINDKKFNKKDLIEIKKKITLLEDKLEKSSLLTIKVKKAWEIQDWLIKDPLSNSGIKAYIFNHMLGLVNEKLKQYGHFLNIEINFGMDLSSAHKDFYISIKKYDGLVFYEDLSGGEQQLINICIAFAIYDVVAMEKNINILILDEVFEGCDSDNMEIISELIKIKAQGKCVHIITHHKDFIPTNAKFIQLKNKGGLTYKSV